MGIMRGIGRGTAVTGRFTGRGLAATGRGLWWLTGWALGLGAVTEVGRDRRRISGIVTVWGVAVALGCIGWGTVGTVYDFSRISVGVSPLIGVVAGLPFGLLRTRPLVGLVVSLAGAAVLALALPLDADLFWSFLVVHGLAIFGLLFATCATESLQRSAGALLLTFALFGWAVRSDLRVGWLVGVTIIAVTGVLTGRLVAANSRLKAQEEAADAEKARRVVLEERTRIARDLHDIVAHHMSLVVVRAETAPYRVPDLSEGARAELESISASARSALAETRTMLTVLRAEGQAAEEAPQPGVEQLEDLFEASRRAGVSVHTTVEGDLSVLRAGASLAAYRIVQEALANVARHAPGAGVVVEVSASPEGVDLRVTNGPTGAGAPVVVVREGHGITGMRERAAAAGGTVTLGPTADGGFVVAAALPVS